MFDFIGGYFFSVLNGFLLGLSLIVAPGVQNLFIIRQRINNNYPYLAALVCSLCDTVLIFLSIAGMGTVISSNMYLKRVIIIISILFLVAFCFRSIKSLTNNIKTIKINDDGINESVNSKFKVFLLSVGLSWMNPQAIIDTLFIIGGTSSNYSTSSSWMFGIGAVLASFSWFFFLSNFAKVFLKYLKSSKFEKILNIFIILIIGLILYQLVNSLLSKGELL